MVILWRRVLAGGSGSMTGRRSDHTEGVKPGAHGLTPAIWSPSFKTRMATGSVLYKAGTCNPISEAWTHLSAHTGTQTQDSLLPSSCREYHCWILQHERWCCTSLAGASMCWIQMHTSRFMAGTWAQWSAHILMSMILSWWKTDLYRAEQEIIGK